MNNYENNQNEIQQLFKQTDKLIKNKKLASEYEIKQNWNQSDEDLEFQEMSQEEIFNSKVMIQSCPGLKQKLLFWLKDDLGFNQNTLSELFGLSISTVNKVIGQVKWGITTVDKKIKQNCEVYKQDVLQQFYEQHRTQDISKYVYIEFIRQLQHYIPTISIQEIFDFMKIDKSKYYTIAQPKKKNDQVQLKHIKQIGNSDSDNILTYKATRRKIFEKTVLDFENNQIAKTKKASQTKYQENLIQNMVTIDNEVLNSTNHKNRNNANVIKRKRETTMVNKNKDEKEY